MTAFKEPFNSFLMELKSQAEYCNFQEKDRMIRQDSVFNFRKIARIAFTGKKFGLGLDC